MESALSQNSQACITPAQKKNLYMEWCCYELPKQKAILIEYLENGGDFRCKDDFLNYLKVRIEVEKRPK